MFVAIDLPKNNGLDFLIRLEDIGRFGDALAIKAKFGDVDKAFEAPEFQFDAKRRKERG